MMETVMETLVTFVPPSLEEPMWILMETMLEMLVITVPTSPTPTNSIMMETVMETLVISAPRLLEEATQPILMEISLEMPAITVPMPRMLIKEILMEILMEMLVITVPPSPTKIRQTPIQMESEMLVKDLVSLFLTLDTLASPTLNALLLSHGRFQAPTLALSESMMP